MRKIKALLRMRLEQNLTQRQCAQSLGVSSSTVWECAHRFKKSALTLEEMKGMEEDALYKALFPATLHNKGSAPKPDFEVIHKELSRPCVTLRLLWEEYKDTHPDGYGYSRFSELYSNWKGKLKVWMRQSHKAGEKVFIDYSGKRPTIVDRHTGEERQVELFVACWGSSHFTYAEAQESQQLSCFLMGHVRAFEYFDCVPHILVPDNLKSAVTRAHRYDPDVNLSYEEMTSHYKASVLPTRPYKPKDKAKVETSVQIVQRWILAMLRNRIFFHLSELNQAIRELLEQLNTRPMQKLGKSRQELFEQVDKPMAQPLPKNKYSYKEWKSATVGMDYHVEVDKCYYSVPYNLYGRRLDIRISQSHIEIFHKGKRVALHQRNVKSFSYTTLTEHMPQRHQKYVQWTPERLLLWAGKAGPHTKELLKKILDSKPHPEQGFRPCLGIKRLGDSFGETQMEEACSYAIKMGLTRVSQIKDILKNKLYAYSQELRPGTVMAKDNIRGTRYYNHHHNPKGKMNHE